MTPSSAREPLSLPKTPTGIPGLDEITSGGLPRGRPTLVCGGAGCGKTTLGVEFLVRGATRYGEPGVLVAFEETAEELARNVASLGFDLEGLIRDQRFAIVHVHLDPSEIELTGPYDLEALFLRIGAAIDHVGAKRVMLDSIETLFGGIPDEATLRAELRRLFRWLKSRGVTAIVTGERGDGAITRHGLEEYVSDCVILLDHRVTHERSTRRLRVVKYRGSTHGTNEYPFLIEPRGVTVLPITSIGLDHPAGAERVTSGIEGLDGMLEGKGFYRGSTVLVSGGSGSGKSAIAARFAESCAARGDRCLYLAHEESPEQIRRNMATLGIDLAALPTEQFRLVANRPSLYGLETHLAVAHALVSDFQPTVVIVDPITSLQEQGTEQGEVQLMLTRLIDFLKRRGVTALLTSLESEWPVVRQLGVTSLVDTWIALHLERRGNERLRALEVHKSRGMAHSEELCRFELGKSGPRVGGRVA